MEKQVDELGDYLKEQVSLTIEGLSDKDITKLAILVAEEIKRTQPMYTGNLNPKWALYDMAVVRLKERIKKNSTELKTIYTVNMVKDYDYYRGIVNEFADLGESTSIKSSDDFKEDLGLDSLDLVELVMTVEKDYNIQIPNYDFDTIEVVQDLYDIIIKKTKKDLVG